VVNHWDIYPGERLLATVTAPHPPAALLRAFLRYGLEHSELRAVRKFQVVHHVKGAQRSSNRGGAALPNS
jgi:hypothetical protein